MNRAKIIKTDQEHQQALERLMQLMDKDPVAGTAEADELDLLALLVEHYERERYPIEPPDPVEAIQFRMDQMGLTRNDLTQYIGSTSRVSEVLNRKRPLSLNMIRKLSSGLGLSADVLIREPNQRSANESDIDWQAFPLAEMRNRGYFDSFSGSLQELKEYAAEHLSRFLDSVPGGPSLRPALLRTSAHLRPNDKEMDSYALCIWQIRVLQKAQATPLPTRYKIGTVNQEFMVRLARESWSSQGPLIAREYLNRHGIHLVTEPHLPRTYLDGAVCKNADGNPVIAFTLRHDRLDNFWFTLMHELAHIALHLDGDAAWFIDDLDVEDNNRVEREADMLAQDVLIPQARWGERKPADIPSVVALAGQLNIAPEIIAGRLRRESNNHKLFGKRFRTKIKPLFATEFART
ncbi:ImmA/IrrE family metallo-endopeptidase [Candidatus Thiosymbion oneisti]|uniref:ImmA/IrrE family metallo-endopeptidase n=1 Tax=Candidatus Thiosymbion oneisti TaxID=589554 RepID=UPI000B293BE3|nr:ImmA/IrrE family metallo-endopeptidase [Candidatus Thiosymbion oneisti]